jgi:hypothetical protein
MEHAGANKDDINELIAWTFGTSTEAPSFA